MDKRLQIHLSMHPDCVLTAIDITDYRFLDVDLLQHTMLEFLSFCDEKVPVSNSIRIRNEIHNRGHYLDKFTSEFLLSKDGTYSYYKLVIPKIEHFEVEDEEGLYSHLKDELFFYDKKLYKTNISNYDEKFTLSELLSKSEQIENYIEAYQYVQDGFASQTLYCPKEMVFSVCKLQKCLLNLQRKMIFINRDTCNYDECKTDKSLRNQRDFIFGAMYVFDYLKDTHNFTEAQRILDNLSSCNLLCDDKFIDTGNSCGCGSSL